MKSANMIASILMGFLSATVIFASRNMAYLDDYGMGYGFMPFWLGVLMFILSICWLYEAIKSDYHDKKFVSNRKGIYRVFALGAAILVVTFLINRLGYILALSVFVLFIVLHFEKQKGSKKQIVHFLALGFTLILTYVIFGKWFGTALPQGFLGI